MSSEENKRIVADGLERRKAEREAAAKEAELERYEQEQIHACNVRSANAKKKRRDEETGRLHRAQLEAALAAEAEVEAKEQAREDAAHLAVRRFCLCCMGIAMVTTWTPLEWWAAAALIAGLAVFPAAYIFRLYFPVANDNR